MDLVFIGIIIYFAFFNKEQKTLKDSVATTNEKVYSSKPLNTSFINKNF